MLNLISFKKSIGLAGIGSALYVVADEELRDDIKSASRGVKRFGRAVYHSCVVSADYKVSLRGLSGEEYDKKKEEVHLRAANRLLKVCMAHGGVYTKFGQHIASMNHILPNEYTSTLSVLQDRNPSVGVEEVELAVNRELGRSIAELFIEFDSEAIAAASLAQVHRAITKEGDEVAVKIQYPGLETEVSRDIQTMRFLAKAMGTIFPEYEYTWLFPEFEQSITLELDFVQEGTNGERVSKMFKGCKNICIPKVHWDYTSRRVLTMDYIHGIKITNRLAIKEAGMDPVAVAKTVTTAFGDMIYYHGFLHCDPHPGNLMVREMPNSSQKRDWLFRKLPKQHQVVLLDHGMYRRLEPEFRLAYCKLWKAFLTRNNKLGAQQAVKFGLNADEYDILSLILTWRPAATRAPMGARITEEERQLLRDRYKGTISAETVNSFLERLPRDMLFIMRTGDLIRGLNKDLGGTSSQRLRLLGEAAIKGLGLPNPKLGTTLRYAGPPKDRELELRNEMEALGLRCPPSPQLVHAHAPVNKLVSSEMGFKESAIRKAWDLAKLRLGLCIAEYSMQIRWWWRGYRSFTTRDIG